MWNRLRDLIDSLSSLANVVILLVWSVVAPLKFERKVVDFDDFGRGKESLGYCSSDMWWWFFSPIAALNFAALLFANQQAYVARKLSTEFAESDYIARAMSLIAIVAMLVVPVDMIAGENSNVHLFIMVSFVSTVAMSLLLYIFVPKIFYRADSATLKTAIRGSVAALQLDNPSSLQFTEPSSAFASHSHDIGGERVVIHPKILVDNKETNQKLEREKEQLISQVGRLQEYIVHLGGTSEYLGLASGDLDSRNQSKDTRSLQTNKRRGTSVS